VFEIYNFKETEIIAFGLIFLRISSCLVLMPIFGSKLIPAPSKALLCIIVAMVMFPVLKTSQSLPMSWKDDLVLLAMREVFVGAFLGFLTRFIFMGVEVAGQLLSITMGLSSVQLINPTFGESSTIMEQFETVLATLLFLALNGHHFLFEALFRSFQLAPVGVLSLSTQALGQTTMLVQEVFVIGIKLAGPIIAVTLFLNIALGIVGRAVPQINVFIISFPVNIMVGLFVFMVSIPLLVTVLDADFSTMSEHIFVFLKGF
jgi:flagellar biosynthetic protein FliR